MVVIIGDDKVSVSREAKRCKHCRDLHLRANSETSLLGVVKVTDLLTEVNTVKTKQVEKRKVQLSFGRFKEIFSIFTG